MVIIASQLLPKQQGMTRSSLQDSCCHSKATVAFHQRSRCSSTGRCKKHVLKLGYRSCRYSCASWRRKHPQAIPFTLQPNVYHAYNSAGRTDCSSTQSKVRLVSSILPFNSGLDKQQRLLVAITNLSHSRFYYQRCRDDNLWHSHSDKLVAAPSSTATAVHYRCETVSMQLQRAAMPNGNTTAPWKYCCSSSYHQTLPLPASDHLAQNLSIPLNFILYNMEIKHTENTQSAFSCSKQKRKI